MNITEEMNEYQKLYSATERMEKNIPTARSLRLNTKAEKDFHKVVLEQTGIDLRKGK